MSSFYKSASSAQAGGTSRGSVLLVGEHPRFDELRRTFTEKIRNAGNLFDALGWLAFPVGTAANCRPQCPDEAGDTLESSPVPVPDPMRRRRMNERIGAILIADEQLIGDMPGAVEALRLIDPTVSIYLLGNEESARVAAFDGVLAPEMTAEQIGVRLFPLRGESGELVESASEALVSIGETLVGDTRSLPEPPIKPPIEAPVIPNAEPPEPLGDTDLVDALMNQPGGVLEAALQLMRQQAQYPDIQFIAANPEEGVAGKDDSEVAVSIDNQLFGFLRIDRSVGGEDSAREHQELSGWADWLARWLALDHAYQQNRRLAIEDELTGAYNRRYFNAFIADSIDTGRRLRRPVTIMLFDLDNFKFYNDHFGHEAGDRVLAETVRLLKRVIRGGDRVCRIGGDEFVVIFADPEEPRELGSQHPVSVESIALRFQEQLRTMKLTLREGEDPPTLTVSAGLATFPWDGDTPQALLRRADDLALESKRRGKNLITFGPGAE